MHDEFVLDLYQFYTLLSIHSFEYCVFSAFSMKCISFDPASQLKGEQRRDNNTECSSEQNMFVWIMEYKMYFF